ncbi:MAG: hypothetical protein ACR2RB_15490 [Gammaproteobacteria bacterium]
MAPLVEMTGVRQHRGEPSRRWFACLDADLFVWHQHGRVSRFEFCYGKLYRECVLSWSESQGFHHARIDDGESNPLRNRTPIEIPDGSYDQSKIATRFETLAGGIEPRLYRQLLKLLYAPL